MLKFTLYLSLMIVGMVGTFINPLIGAIACLEAYLMNPAAISMDGADLRFQFFTTVTFLISVFVHRSRGAMPAGRESFPLIWLWIFIGIGYLSSLWAVISTQNALDELYELLKTIVVATAILRVIRTERDMSWLMMACIGGIWHASVMHTFGVRWGFVRSIFGREYGVMPEAQTSVLILFIPVIMVVAIRGSKWERIVALCTLPFALNSIVYTYQRMGLLVLAVEAILLLLLLPRRITLALLPILAIGGGLFVFRLTPDNYWDWMSTIKSPTQEGSANSRWVINEASRRMLMDYPLGVGYRNYLNVSPRYLDAGFLSGGQRSAHNSYYTIACETGIPGFIAWIMAFGSAAWLLRRIRKRTDPSNTSPSEIYAMGLEVGLYGWFIGGLTHDLHNVDPAFWFLTFAVALTRLQHQNFVAEAADEAVDDATDPVQANAV